MTCFRRGQPTALALLLAAAACSTSTHVVGKAPETTPDEAPRHGARGGAERMEAIQRHENASAGAEPKVEEVRRDEPRIGVAATNEIHKPDCSRLAGVAPAEQIL